MKDAIAIRQCQENIQALCRYHSLPELVIVANEAYKIQCKHRQVFVDCIKAMTPKYFEVYDYVGMHGLTAKRGWRERRFKYLLQIIEHEEPDGCPVLIELDVDICNPNFGIISAIGHLIEVLWPGNTDPFRVMRGLQKRGIPVRDMRLLEGTT